MNPAGDRKGNHTSNALMSEIAARISWQFPDDYSEGDVSNGTNVLARLKMGLV